MKGSMPVPLSALRSTLPVFKKYRHFNAVTDIKDFPDRAHFLTIDSGWRVADVSLAWLKEQSL